MNLQEAAEKFVIWLDTKVLLAGRGDELDTLDVEPSGRFWLGRLAPEDAVIALGLGDRGERLDPCATGIRVRPASGTSWSFTVKLSMKYWTRDQDRKWHKSETVRRSVGVLIPSTAHNDYSFGSAELEKDLALLTNSPDLKCEVRVEARTDYEGRFELTVLLVNTSSAKGNVLADTNLYECSLRITGLVTEYFVLESLPDSFRYDRRVLAYGVNCGVTADSEGGLRTTDTIVVDRTRPKYWNTNNTAPDLEFDTLSENPLPSLKYLLSELTEWGSNAWSADTLNERAKSGSWPANMRQEADSGAEEFQTEVDRISKGLNLLENDATLLRAFRLMNAAMAYSASGKYNSWRPFQIGYLLANIETLTDPRGVDVVDIVWFATGGGKTETYSASSIRTKRFLEYA